MHCISLLFVLKSAMDTFQILGQNNMLTDPLQKTLMCLNISNSVDTISVWYFHGLLAF